MQDFATTQPQLIARQQELIAEGFRIESIVKGRGNNRTIWARCIGQ